MGGYRSWGRMNKAVPRVPPLVVIFQTKAELHGEALNAERLTNPAQHQPKPGLCTCRRSSPAEHANTQQGCTVRESVASGALCIQVLSKHVVKENLSASAIQDIWRGETSGK